MQSKGLTLLELLASLSIAAILMAVATPGFAQWINKNRLRTAAYNLLTDIQKTRSEAVNRASRVTLRNSDKGWDTGWQMFVDDDADGNFDTGETLLFEREAISANVSISGNSAVSSMVSYGASGQSLTPAGAFQAGTITLCGSGVSKAYQIVLSRGGRARLVSDDGSSNWCP